MIIICALLLAALTAWILYAALNKTGDTKRVYAEILYENDVVETVYLNEDRQFSIEQLPNVVFEVKERKISFVQSDCPDQVCVHSGWLDKDGHFAACLPNRVILRIVDEEGSGIDAVTK